MCRKRKKLQRFSRKTNCRITEGKSSFVHLWRSVSPSPKNQNFAVLEGSDERWDLVLSEFSERDVYLNRLYQRLSYIHTGRQSFAFYNQSDGDRLFFPILVGELPEAYQIFDETLYDFESAYGYGGPLCTTTDEEKLTLLFAPIWQWCRDQNIVAGFTRFHPLLNNHRYFVESSVNKVDFNRQTIYIDFEPELDQIWSGLPSGQRSQIRQAIKYGLSVRSGDQRDMIDIFYPMYRANLEVLSAHDHTYFKQDYFEFLSTKMQEAVDLLIVEKDGNPIASAIFLRGDDFYHYHLSASLYEFQRFRPNNLMLYEAIKLGKSLGLKKFHLGGGRSDAPDDTLLRFKRSFSKAIADYYVARSIISPGKYRKLAELYEEQQGVSPNRALVHFYRI